MDIDTGKKDERKRITLWLPFPLKSTNGFESCGKKKGSRRKHWRGRWASPIRRVQMGTGEMLPGHPIPAGTGGLFQRFHRRPVRARSGGTPRRAEHGLRKRPQVRERVRRLFPPRQQKRRATVSPLSPAPEQARLKRACRHRAKTRGAVGYKRPQDPLRALRPVLRGCGRRRVLRSHRRRRAAHAGGSTGGAEKAAHRRQGGERALPSLLPSVIDAARQPALKGVTQTAYGRPRRRAASFPTAA